ncbi:MAG: tetratricopeptide repeat protein [Candidatus Auribacter fodinae]|jgi:tetratricopeptide (TPR) repeat protein|uniref:Tetratricopeptide repeat protein n=1 Tax=Candidatus Auribacter fodinae TaxID=2093366 RepID=A0A3A4R342_9BACT|nr:MAG: tetratricopeptide repeat protein [Candidatus Auribacter fodinae]
MKKFSVYLVLVLACFLAFGNTIVNDFVYDDASVIKDNRFLKKSENIYHLLSKQDYFARSGVGKYKRYGEGSYRPIVTLSYFLDYAISENNPVVSHTMNLLYHTATVIIIYHLLLLLSGNGIASMLASVFFAIHPTGSEAINAISFREDILCAFFVCTALYCYLLFIENRRKQNWLFLMTAVCYFLACLSKENGFILPAILFLATHMIFYSESKLPFFQQVKNTLPTYIILSAVGLVYLLLRFGLFNYVSIEDEPDIPFFMRIIRFINVLVYYLRLTLIPGQLTPAYNKNFLESARYLFISVPVLTGLLSILFFYRKKFPLVSFGISWYLIFLLPVSGLMYLQHPVAERYIYLPMIGILLVISLYISTLTYRKKMLLPVLCILIFFLIQKSLTQNIIWNNEFSLWEHAVKYAPKNYNALANYAVVLADSGKTHDSIIYYQKALKIEDRAQSHYNLANSYNRLGMKDKAEVEYKRSIELDPLYSESHNNLGKLLAEQGKYEEAIVELRTACKLSPYNVKAYNNLGACLNHLKQHDEAIKVLQYALKLAPTYTSALFNLTTAYFKKGDTRQAEKTLQRIMEIDPGNQNVEQYLQVIRSSMNQPANQPPAPKPQVKTEPPSLTDKPIPTPHPIPPVNDQVKNVSALIEQADKLMNDKDYPQALSLYRNAVQIDGMHEEIRYKLAECYIKLGSFSLARRELLKATAINPEYEAAKKRLAEVEKIIRKVPGLPDTGE